MNAILSAPWEAREADVVFIVRPSLNDSEYGIDCDGLYLIETTHIVRGPYDHEAWF